MSIKLRHFKHKLELILSLFELFWLILKLKPIFCKLSIENIEFTLVIKVKIEQRDGKDHLTITNTSTNFDASHIAVEFKYRNTATLINGVVNRLINTNWKAFKGIASPSIDKFIEEMMKSVCSPMLSQIACQDFFNME